MAWRRSILVIFFALPLHVSAQRQPTPLALRAAVPLLCTENLASRTYVRGTGVIADSSGTLLTAAHVIEQAHANCTLSVMIPDDEWTRIGVLRRFSLLRCHMDEILDLAVCRIQPADNRRDLAYLRAARIQFRSPVSREPVWVSGFTGWLLAPLVRSGFITGLDIYRPQDGCRCNFATDIVAVPGMSGSPIISYSGDVLGIVTQAGRGKFRGASFGVSFSEARNFLLREGVVPSPPPL